MHTKLSLLLCCYFASIISLTAQVVSGEIIYEVKDNLHMNLSPEAEMYKNDIPEYRKSKNKLIFSQSESIYTNIKVEEKDQPREDRRRRRGNRGNRDHKIYKDIAQKQSVEYIDFLSKKFLIDRSQDVIKWKISADQKQVGQYLCQKAIFQDSTNQIEAWFTPMIPVSAGPDRYANLPGMVLHVDVNGGKRLITAIEINPRELEPNEIQKPTDGEDMSAEEFDALREEKMKEMQARRGNRRGPRGPRRN